MSDAVQLLTNADVKELCQGLGIRPTKTLGQNFVCDANTVAKIAATPDYGPDAHILEVGPGLGSLTLALLAHAPVTAVEIDPKLVHYLPQTVRAHAPSRLDSLRIIHQDALTIAGLETLNAPLHAGTDPALDRAPTHLVANLPYNVAVPVLLTLMAAIPTISTVVVMVQAEVADRLAAPPGSRTYGVPSAKLAWYGQARRGATIGRSVFWPVPHVDSALVVCHRHAVTSWQAQRETTFGLIDAAFSQRRKTLRAALKKWLPATHGVSVEALEQAAAIDFTLRGEALGIAEFDALAAALEQIAGPAQ